MKIARNYLFIPLVAFLFCVVAAATKAEEKASDKPEKVTKIKLTGVFESAKAHEVTFDTHHFTDAIIRKIVEHGASVERGSFLVSFERDKYAKQLKAAVRKMKSSELARKESAFAHEQFMETQKLDRAAAQRTWEAAQNEYQGYLEFDRQYAIDSAKFSLQQSRNSLEYLEEDLRQLERMYEEDELTEESEELVLIRARRAIESAKFRLRNTEVRTERTLQQSLPREIKNRQATYQRAKLAYGRSISDLEIARKKKQIEIETSDEAFQEEQEKLTELRADGDKLVIESPAKGLVLYGKLNRGQLADKASTMQTGTKIAKDQTILTIVNPKRLRIRCTVAEKDISQLKMGMRGRVTPTSQPNQVLDATIESLNRVPFAKGKYDCVLSIKGTPKAILPTMTCSIEFEPDTKSDSVSQPRKNKQKKRKKEPGKQASKKE